MSLGFSLVIMGPEKDFSAVALGTELIWEWCAEALYLGKIEIWNNQKYEKLEENFFGEAEPGSHIKTEQKAISEDRKFELSMRCG